MNDIAEEDDEDLVMSEEEGEVREDYEGMNNNNNGKVKRKWPYFKSDLTI